MNVGGDSRTIQCNRTYVKVINCISSFLVKCYLKMNINFIQSEGTRELPYKGIPSIYKCIVFRLLSLTEDIRH